MNDLTVMSYRKAGEEYAYSSDVVRIQEAARDCGFMIEQDDAYRAWKDYSETMAAGWMRLDNSSHAIWRNISHYFEEK